MYSSWILVLWHYYILLSLPLENNPKTFLLLLSSFMHFLYPEPRVTGVRSDGANPSNHWAKTGWPPAWVFSSSQGHMEIDSHSHLWPFLTLVGQLYNFIVIVFSTNGQTVLLVSIWPVWNGQAGFWSKLLWNRATNLRGGISGVCEKLSIVSRHVVQYLTKQADLAICLFTSRCQHFRVASEKDRDLKAKTRRHLFFDNISQQLTSTYSNTPNEGLQLGKVYARQEPVKHPECTFTSHPFSWHVQNLFS